ncbi:MULTISPECIES: LacI family DNA-binding transcriptional regulator [Silvimonas]|uniref:LacI family DNA-binding transcriptional regulator n=1 Tax=Silvimonas TaxID=300264 RepID=UPI0024B3A2C8|nr:MULTISPECIES: LacI family DNA-binding transcriptional regulator [Silvimonas]MDR3427227.1 LacI family DNA-binding transcriptional regulator [Silvimonas sp.]
MVTLAEVAQRADVTPATVSNTLRNPGKVHPKTLERVLAAIKELGYRPNLNARALAEGRSATLALLVSDIANPFYPEYVREAERAARRAGQFLMVCNTDDDAATSQAYLHQMAGTLAAGVIIMNTGLSLDELQTAAAGTPLMLSLWEYPEAPPPGLSCVAVDFAHAGRLAAEHLLTFGHREFGAIIGTGCGGRQSARYSGFARQLHMAGIDHAEDACIEVRDTIEGGFEAARTLLDRHPGITAFFATNDLMAIGAMQAATAQGKRVPEDISVIGITNIRLAQQMRPALTSVAIDTPGIAAQSVAMLLAQIAQPATPPRMERAAEPWLVVRDSTGPVRRSD